MTKRIVCATICLVWLVGTADEATCQSRLMGDRFTFSTTNFPSNLGETQDPVTREFIEHATPPAELTFDGIEESAGGMLVNERAVPFAGIPGGIDAVQAATIDGEAEFVLTDWEFDGEIVEFSFQTADGEWIADEPTEQSTYTIRDLDWRSSQDSQPFFFETGWFFYWTIDGTPISGYETTLADIGLLVGPHPFDTEVPEVVYIAYSAAQVDEITDPFDGSMDLTFGTSQLDEDNGSYDLLAEVMGLPQFGAVDGKAANGFHVGFLVEPPLAEPVAGDVNLDGLLTVTDFDEQARALREGLDDARYDLNNDNSVTAEDRRVLIDELANTYMGDANFDGEFNSGDFVQVFQAGQYEDGVAENSTWSTGDWDGNLEFDSGDFVVAFQAGGFEVGPRAAVAAVPEPSGLLLATFALTGILMVRRRSKTP